MKIPQRKTYDISLYCYGTSCQWVELSRYIVMHESDTSIVGTCRGFRLMHDVKRYIYKDHKCLNCA